MHGLVRAARHSRCACAASSCATARRTRAVAVRREGENAVKMGRQMLGATNPQDSLPGTIRGDFSIVVGRNICHGSDSAENAEKEIKLWFKEGEVCDWSDHSNDWIYE